MSSAGMGLPVTLAQARITRAAQQLPIPGMAATLRAPRALSRLFPDVTICCVRLNVLLVMSVFYLGLVTYLPGLAAVALAASSIVWWGISCFAVHKRESRVPGASHPCTLPPFPTSMSHGPEQASFSPGLCCPLWCGDSDFCCECRLRHGCALLVPSIWGIEFSFLLAVEERLKEMVVPGSDCKEGGPRSTHCTDTGLPRSLPVMGFLSSFLDTFPLPRTVEAPGPVRAMCHSLARPPSGPAFSLPVLPLLWGLGVPPGLSVPMGCPLSPRCRPMWRSR